MTSCGCRQAQAIAKRCRQAQAFAKRSMSSSDIKPKLWYCSETALMPVLQSEIPHRALLKRLPISCRPPFKLLRLPCTFFFRKDSLSEHPCIFQDARVCPVGLVRMLCAGLAGLCRHACCRPFVCFSLFSRFFVALLAELKDKSMWHLRQSVV